MEEFSTKLDLFVLSVLLPFLIFVGYLEGKLEAYVFASFPFPWVRKTVELYNKQ